MANVKISALPAGSTAAGGDVPMVQAGVTNKLTLGTLAYQAASAVAITGGTITGLSNLTIANAGTLTPASSDGAALGTAALMWADLFLASGGVVNFNNGDVTITHAADTLTFAGATTTGYQFQDGPLRPVANDGIALGVSGTAFADLFLATGGVINWNAGDVTITHAANTLTFAGATTTGYQFQDGPIRPVANDGVALGVSGTAFSDLFLANGGIINWNAANMRIIHSAGALTVSGGNLIFPGTGTNDDAAAGIVGELIESEITQGSAVSLTTGTTANVTSISLTAGDWDVWGSVWFNPAATTTITRYSGAISSSSATLPTAPGSGAYFVKQQASLAPNVQEGFPVGMRRISLSGTTTIYLVARATFADSTLSAYGYIGARRRR